MTGPPLWGNGGGPIAPGLLCLHWLTARPDPGTVGYDPRAFSDEAELQRVVRAVARVPADASLDYIQRKGRASYGAVWWGGRIRLGVAPGNKAGHAAGSPGLDDANSNSFGVAIPYISPSFPRGRGIEGEVQLPFVERYVVDGQTRYRERLAWYPPLDEEMLVQLVRWLRAFFLEQGWEPAGLITHSDINPRKNDVRNLTPELRGRLNDIFLGLA